MLYIIINRLTDEYHNTLAESRSQHASSKYDSAATELEPMVKYGQILATLAGANADYLADNLRSTVPIIRRLLRTGSDDIKKAALECIFSLTRSSDFCNRIFDSAMVGEFHNILRRGSRDVKYAAIGAFDRYTDNGK
jgi:hypothetical protein